MNQIQDGRINQFLQRRLNITDAPAPASTLAPEVMPVLSVIPARREDDYLRGEFNYGAVYSSVGGVGTYPILRIYNPTNSGSLVIVERAIVYQVTAAASCQYGIGLGATLGLSQVASTGLDTRRPPNATAQNAIARLEGDAIAAPPFIGGPIIIRINQTFSGSLDLGIVLTPGYALDLFNQGTNQTFVANLFWRERQAQPSELV